MALTQHLEQAFQFTQVAASTTWTIVHNLDRYPAIDAYILDNGVRTRIIADVTYIDNNTCTVNFDVPYAGFATVV